jgi:hypothetical protein
MPEAKIAAGCLDGAQIVARQQESILRSVVEPLDDGEGGA